MLRNVLGSLGVLVLISSPALALKPNTGSAGSKAQETLRDAQRQQTEQQQQNTRGGVGTKAAPGNVSGTATIPLNSGSRTSTEQPSGKINAATTVEGAASTHSSGRTKSKAGAADTAAKGKEVAPAVSEGGRPMEAKSNIDADGDLAILKNTTETTSKLSAEAKQNILDGTKDIPAPLKAQIQGKLLAQFKKSEGTMKVADVAKAVNEAFAELSKGHLAEALAESGVKPEEALNALMALKLDEPDAVIHHAKEFKLLNEGTDKAAAQGLANLTAELSRNLPKSGSLEHHASVLRNVADKMYKSHGVKPEEMKESCRL